MLLFSFLFALIQVPTTSCNDDPSYTNCSTTIRCGSIQNLRYPFWGMNRASYCGQPEFNLSCQDDVAKITMDRITFRVLDANPTDRTLTVARDDYWNGYCPEELMNTTINFNKFEYGGRLRNLTLFYGCSSPSIYNCDTNGAVLYDTESFIGDLYLCRSNVIVPVHETAARTLDMNPLTLNDALRGGFELQWVVDNEQCRKCRASDGACGYNQTTDRFVCFRRDQLSQTNFSQTQAPTSVHADDGNISSCSARLSCGDLKNIGYPFWGLDRPESCGHPAFKLNCSGDIPTIVINSATYRVLKIDSSSRDLEVARDDYFDNICPTYLINSTFIPTLFELNGNSQNINLYYGCPSITSVVNPNATMLPGISGQFDCTINQTENIVGYFVTRNFTELSFGPYAPDLSSFFRTCSHNVIIPVLSSEIQSLEQNPNSDNLNEALKVGFELQWFADDSLCNSCERSDGQCGHDISTGEFRCYCSDGAFPNTCSTGSPESGDKKDIPLIAGLGIAGAVVAGILLGMGILRYRQKRKKIADQIKSRDLLKSPSTKDLLSTSTTNLSQSIPSYPTSNYDLERGSTYFGAHVFSYEELEAATDNFDPSKQLGEGGFGIVYFGVLHDGRVVAVKRLFENNFKRVEQYMNEIEILTKIRHVNLVTLYGCTSRRSRELLLVYEYIPNGTVADHLHGKFSKTSLLPWTVRLNIAIETANGLAYLHAKDIIHRDVKTNNILLDNNFHVKVADFGLSRLFPNDVTHVSTAPQGTPGYVDPEYFQCYQLTEKSDVYSFGVVLAELVSAKQAVDTSRHRLDINLANMAVSRIQNHALHELVDPSLGFETDNEVKSSVTAVSGLAFRCLQQEREMRPSMEEVLECLKGIQNPNLGAQKAEVLDINSEAEVVDIGSDDVGLLKNLPPPLSPDSVNEKWMQVRSM